MHIAITTMTEQYARAILAWHYEGPYAFYNADPHGRQDDMGELLDGCYYAATEDQGELVGFFSSGATAQVPGGHRYGLYADDALDVGLGLRPDLTGRGLGRDLLAAGLDFARQRFSPKTFRLSVATFNERAIRLYEKAGFQVVATCASSTESGETLFLLMTMAATSPGSHPEPTSGAAAAEKTAPRAQGTENAARAVARDLPPIPRTPWIVRMLVPEAGLWRAEKRIRTLQALPAVGDPFILDDGTPARVAGVCTPAMSGVHADIYVVGRGQ